MYLKKSIDFGLNLLLPNDLQCAACERYRNLVKWQLCEDCLDCLEPVDFELSADQYGLERLVSCFYYNQFAKKMIYRHKAEHHRYYSKIFANMIQERLRRADIKIDGITWIPTAADRIARRGCDHAKDIARALAEQMAVPTIPLLEYSRRHGTQKRLSRENRIENMIDAFICRRPVSEGLSILIIDDVVTTGATIKSAAEAILKRNTGCHLFAATVFYTPPKNSED
ncbi:MAG: hypothetical protein CSA13_02035 [Clostridiales bacterium]|nr:MAG: hypothetical protein CSA13_02035 [Clostridiales bacterium]